MKIHIQTKTLQQLNQYVQKRLNWMNAWNRLEETVKYVIKAGDRKSFWCDSHPWLCSCCSTLRFRILTGKYPDKLVINTKYGRYEYYHKRKLKCQLISNTEGNLPK